MKKKIWKEFLRIGEKLSHTTKLILIEERMQKNIKELNKVMRKLRCLE